MLRSITAEFEHFDSAEMASRKIRRNVNGIRKIKIASHKMSKRNGHDSYYKLIPTAITTQNYVTLSMSNSLNDRISEPQTTQTTILTVICTEEVSSQVHRILTSSGGIYISSEIFIP